MNLRNRVEKRLKEIGKLQSWLANELGVEKQNVNNWLRRDKIPEEYIFKAARLLRCTAEWLAGEPTKNSYKVNEPSGSYNMDEKTLKRIEAIENAPEAVRDALDRMLGLSD